MSTNPSPYTGTNKPTGTAGGALTGSYPNPSLATQTASLNMGGQTIINAGAASATLPNFSLAFGDGSDGGVTFDGTTSVLGISPSGSAYTMTRDILCTGITINSGVTVNPAGYRMFCQGTVTNSGTISNSGANASGSTGGSGGSGGTTRGGSTGGAGGTGVSGAGGNATAITSPGGGAGGNGGTGNAGAAGTGGSIGGAHARSEVFRSAHPAIAVNQMFAATFQYAGGTGGGGGGSDASSNAGGGGGGGGGMVFISGYVVNNGAGTINAAGGNGGNAAGGNAGGGGAGGGGNILVYSLSAWTAGTTNVAAGNVGNKAGSGANGAAGQAGTVTNVVVS